MSGSRKLENLASFLLRENTSLSTARFFSTCKSANKSENATLRPTKAFRYSLAQISERLDAINEAREANPNAYQEIVKFFKEEPSYSKKTKAELKRFLGADDLMTYHVMMASNCGKQSPLNPIKNRDKVLSNTPYAEYFEEGEKEKEFTFNTPSCHW